MRFNMVGKSILVAFSGRQGMSFFGVLLSFLQTEKGQFLPLTLYGLHKICPEILELQIDSSRTPEIDRWIPMVPQLDGWCLFSKFAEQA